MTAIIPAFFEVKKESFVFILTKNHLERRKNTHFNDPSLSRIKHASVHGTDHSAAFPRKCFITEYHLFGVYKKKTQFKGCTSKHINLDLIENTAVCFKKGCEIDRSVRLGLNNFFDYKRAETSRNTSNFERCKRSHRPNTHKQSINISPNPCDSFHLQLQFSVTHTFTLICSSFHILQLKATVCLCTPCHNTAPCNKTANYTHTVSYTQNIQNMGLSVIIFLHPP